jgi:hypothetical protein
MDRHPAADVTARRAAIAGVWAIALFGCGACAHSPPTGRFLYEVTWDATLTRYDTVTKRRTDTFDLTKRTGNTPWIPSAPKPPQVLEICLTDHTVFDARSSRFYTVVPLQSTPRDDMKMSYRVLGFSVPSVALVSQMPAGNDLAYPPSLYLEPDGRVEVYQDSDTSGPDRGKLSSMIPGIAESEDIVEETSAARALIRSFADNHGVFGVADSATKSVVWLRSPLTTNYQYVHLAPGEDSRAGRANRGGRVERSEDRYRRTV